jgi:hypothetical protein
VVVVLVVVLVFISLNHLVFEELLPRLVAQDHLLEDLVRFTLKSAMEFLYRGS